MPAFGEAIRLVRVSPSVQIWFWPTLPKPYRVQARLLRPGQSYRLHSAHETQAEAEQEAIRLASQGA